MPVSSAGGRFQSSIPIPGEHDLMGPLLQEVASYLDNELDGSWLKYEAVTGDPANPVANGGQLSVDYAALYEEIRSTLISTGAIDQPEFSWLCGDFLAWDSANTEIDVEIESLAEELKSRGVVGRRKFSGLTLVPICFEIGTGVATGSGRQATNWTLQESMIIQTLDISIKRGVGYSDGGVKIAVSTDESTTTTWYELSGSEVFAHIKPATTIQGSAFYITAYYSDPNAQAGQKVVGCATLTLRRPRV